MKMSFENELGAQAPLGFWDPLYWLENADQERFDRLRYVEIKHGRISMLAVLGHIVQENVRLPGMLSISNDVSFADMPNGLGAIGKVRSCTAGVFGVSCSKPFVRGPLFLLFYIVCGSYVYGAALEFTVPYSNHSQH